MTQAETLRPTEQLKRGQHIRTCREFLGISQAQMAFDAGLSQGYLCQVEEGEVKELGCKAAISIAQALGVGIDFFQGKPDTHVFLKPLARRISQIVSAPQLDNKRRQAIANAISTFIPETEDPKIKYIERERVLQKGEIGQAIREARGNRKQGEVAQDVDVSQGYFSQLENGNVDYPSLSVLRRAANVLAIDIYSLLGIKEKFYQREIEILDRFLRSDCFTPLQKAVISDRLILAVSIIQPIVNRIDPMPQ